MKEKLLSPKALVMADQLVVSGGSFLTQLLLARGLGLEGYGYFSFIVLAQLFLLSVQQAGLTGIAAVIYPSLTNDKKQSYTGGVMGMQALFLLGVVLLCAGYALLFPHQFSTLDALAGGLNIVFFLAQDWLRRMLIVGGKWMPSFLSSCANYGLQLAALLFFFRGGLDFSVTLWICALTYLPSLAFGLLSLRPKLPTTRDVQAAFTLGKSQSGWMVLSALLQWLGGNFYIVAAGWWLGPAALGALRLSQYLFGLLNILMQAVESYALPKAASLRAPHEVIAYARTLFRKLATATFPLLLIMALATNPLLRWLGKTSTALNPAVIYGFAILYVCITIGYPVRMVLRALSLNRAYFSGYVLTTLFSLGTAWVFIHQWAETGVVTGMILAQVMLLLYWLWTIKKEVAGAWRSSI